MASDQYQKEEQMKKAFMGLAMLPFLVGVASAGQPLSNQQMDRVTAGFIGIGIADAEGLVGASGIVITTTATLGQVAPIARATLGETSSTLWKSIGASQASVATSTFPVSPIPGVGP